MKGFVLCFILAVGGLNAHTVQLSTAQKEKADQYTVECTKETGARPEVIAEIKKGVINESDDLKKFALCLFKKSGIIGSDGELNVETALAKLPFGVDKAESKKVLDECKNKKGATPQDTVFQMFKCYHSGIKTHLSVDV